jgi:hypothetical protein
MTRRVKNLDPAGVLTLRSLSTYFNGQAFFHINGGRQAVGDGSYIIVNRGQPFAFTIR